MIFKFYVLLEWYITLSVKKGESQNISVMGE